MIKRFLFLIVAIIGLTLIPCITLGAETFYEGKMIRIIVGYSPGGGYDIYARAIARHMLKHIPGHPAIIVENMPGAGGLISANHLYRVAKPDSLTMAHFNGGLFFNQLMGEPGIEFDSRKFEYIGAAVTGYVVCLLSKASGITNIDKWMASKTPVKMGGVAPGAFSPDNCTRILKVALGLPIQLVSGYKGISEVRLATESGELAGTVGAWYGVRASWRKVIETGDVVVVLQATPNPFLDHPNVPLAINLAKTKEARQLIEAGIHSNGVFTWPFVLPPATPKERVQILRKAFQETLKDKEFLAEAEKAKLALDPVTGDELEKAIAEIFKIDSAIVAQFKEILFK